MAIGLYGGSPSVSSVATSTFGDSEDLRNYLAGRNVTLGGTFDYPALQRLYDTQGGLVDSFTRTYGRTPTKLEIGELMYQGQQEIKAGKGFDVAQNRMTQSISGGAFGQVAAPGGGSLGGQPPVTSTGLTSNAGFDPAILKQYLDPITQQLTQLGGQVQGLGANKPLSAEDVARIVQQTGLSAEQVQNMLNTTLAGAPRGLGSEEVNTIIANQIKNIPAGLTPEQVDSIIGQRLGNLGQLTSEDVRGIISGVLAQQPQVPRGITAEEASGIFRTELGKQSGIMASDYTDAIKTLIPQFEAMEERRLDKFFPGWRASRTALGGIANENLANLGQIPESVKGQYLESLRSAQGLRGITGGPQQAHEEALGMTGLGEEMRSRRLNETIAILGIPLPTSPSAYYSPDYAQLGGTGNSIAGLTQGQQGLDLQRQGLAAEQNMFQQGLGAGSSAQGGRNIMGGALGGASIGSSFGPLGAAIGGLGGGLLGAFF